MARSNFIRGTMLLTGASFLSKFLGMIYVIPFTNMVGETGMTLYQFAYTPYNIMLSISTVGVPLAVSKFVAKYNSLDDYYTSMRMFKLGTILMFISGIIAFILMYFGAEGYTALIWDPRTEGLQEEDLVNVIKMTSFALIIIPGMSIMRGFFQGNESMGPTAVSQVVEQVVRIIFLLVAVFTILVLYNGSTSTAIGFATFAAFIGGIASWVVLAGYWAKRRKSLNKQVQEQKEKRNLPTKELVSELFRYAGPFVLVGIATSLYQLVDQFTFLRAMAEIGKSDISSIAYSSFSTQGHKLVIIPVTIATGLSLALIPEITKAFHKAQMERVKQLINQALQIIMFFVLPAVFGLMILSHDIYTALFGGDEISITGPLFAWYAPVALTFAFFTVTASILQGIERQQFTVISLSAGILIKLLLNSIMIQTFGAKGAIITTILATLVAVVMNLWQIRVKIKFSYKKFIKLSILMSIFTFFMSVILLLMKWLTGYFITYEDGRFQALIITMVGVVLGGGTYLYLGYASTLFERIVGRRIKILDRLFGR
ncbi:Membrane protein involved in the export of O-antigen and teichoic acid [Gracilibacillus ureilyticus]|uniref:Membrane protein involved in the export of O-antigen and teichoic acid n=1 Tax=Gracilibacillus ureilyticus TaxID=531814 RepID=A0A1H9TE20_9BACI|nr:polysaccharide biosynthesis protein [Gracilibacillus ureilyticus]SER95358.1 Membrane protein involved in the export of O-antigen and teichoic acid [Gracilibacillus ureilyticus]